MLHSVHHILKHLILFLVPLHLLNIDLQPLVQLLLISELGLQIRHLLHFALVDLNDGLVTLQIHDLLFDLFELIRESFDSVFILSCNQ